MTSTNSELLKVLVKSGPWAVLAGVLLMVILWDIRPSLASVPTIRAEHAEMRAEFNASQKQLLEYAKRSAYLEFRNCINTAQTDDQRQLCAYREP